MPRAQAACLLCFPSRVSHSPWDSWHNGLCGRRLRPGEHRLEAGQEQTLLYLGTRAGEIGDDDDDDDDCFLLSNYYMSGTMLSLSYNIPCCLHKALPILE